MNLVHRYLERETFTNYEDFAKNLKINVPESFNFAYDIIDEYARLEPERLALVWCDDTGEEKRFTFADLKFWSDKTANFLKKNGIKKGDKVMLILRRRYEFYFFCFALCKIGAVYIPSTNQLKEKDIYIETMPQCQMIVAYNCSEIIDCVNKSCSDSETLESTVLVGGAHEG